MVRARWVAAVLLGTWCVVGASSAQTVDAQKLKDAAAKWEQALDQAKTTEEAVRIAEEALLTFEEALAAKQFEAAERLAQAAVAAANAARHVKLRTDALACKYALTGARREFDDMQNAVLKLGANPRDSAGNLAFGKYLCFTQRNWQVGFTKLMLCDDPVLQPLATRSFTFIPGEAAAAKTLGDAWWDASLKRPPAERLQYQIAAVYFYGQMKLPFDPRNRALVQVQKRVEAVSTEANKARRLPGLIEIPLREDVRLRLRLIPAGSFLMGSSPIEQGRNPAAEAQNTVAVPQPFYMGTTEVTQKQWSTLRPGNNNCAFVGDDLPVENVTWDQATQFVDKLNTVPQARGYRFRLPTAAEWEYACRAGSRTAYFFGNEPTGLSNYAWTADVADAKTHPVGQKKPNPWGLYDMLANVREWTADRYKPTANDMLTDDDQGERNELYVVRGGDYTDNLYQCRSAALRWQRRVAGTDVTGFRVVCDILPLDVLQP